jgi:hypothetical protein
LFVFVFTFSPLFFFLGWVGPSDDAMCYKHTF